MINIDRYFKEFPNKSLFHYTGISSLLGIEKSKSIWASSVYYLNDGEEVLFAQKKFTACIMKRLESSEGYLKDFLCELNLWLMAFTSGGFNLFLFSLSEERSLLSQWRSYTPHGKGVSIEFTPTIIGKIMDKNNLVVARCRYSNEEHKEVVEGLLESMISTFEKERETIDISNRPKSQKYLMYLEKFRGAVLQVFSIIKHPAFSEEKEWRLMSSYFPSFVVPEIQYREGASMLVPYMEFKMDRFYDVPNHTHAVFFKSVCLGPSPHVNLTLNALSQFISNKKVAHETSNSNIPYREW